MSAPAMHTDTPNAELRERAIDALRKWREALGDDIRPYWLVYRLNDQGRQDLITRIQGEHLDEYQIRDDYGPGNYQASFRCQGAQGHGLQHHWTVSPPIRDREREDSPARAREPLQRFTLDDIRAALTPTPSPPPPPSGGDLAAVLQTTTAMMIEMMRSSATTTNAIITALLSRENKNETPIGEALKLAKWLREEGGDGGGSIESAIAPLIAHIVATKPVAQPAQSPAQARQPTQPAQGPARLPERTETIQEAQEPDAPELPDWIHSIADLLAAGALGRERASPGNARHARYVFGVAQAVATIVEANVEDPVATLQGFAPGTLSQLIAAVDARLAPHAAYVAEVEQGLRAEFDPGNERARQDENAKRERAARRATKAETNGAPAPDSAQEHTA